MAQIFKSLIGETLEFSWPITTSGQIIPLEGRNLSLVLVGPDNVEIPLDYTIEHTNVVCFTYEGASQSVPGIYTATLYENRGEENQAVVDQDAFELVETIDLFNWGNNTSLWSVTKHESKEDGGVNTLVLRFSNRKTLELHTVNGSKGTGSYDAITDEEIDAMFSDESSDQPTVLRFASQDGLRRFLNKLKTMFVDGLGVSGDALTWTVGNRVLHITVPFATKAAKDANGNDIHSTYATKNEVNAKQGTIDDLEEIRRGARLGATSIQEHQDISGKQDNIADLEEIRRGAALGATSIQQHQDISGKQDKLVSGGNIKTVNGQTLLGEGDIVIIGEQGVPGKKGDPFTYEDLTDPQKAEIAKDATAAAQQAAVSAQDAANSASAAEQKVTIIDNAIKSLDPSQSTDDAVKALAAKQGVLEADLADLGPKIDEVEQVINPKSEEDAFYVVDGNGKVLATFNNVGLSTIAAKIKDNNGNLKDLLTWLNEKQDAEEGKGLSEENYTTEEKAKVGTLVSSDVLFAICDKRGKCALIIDNEGNVTFNGQDELGNKPLSGYELFSLGDSLSTSGVWQDKVAELTGCTFDNTKNNYAQAPLSVGGSITFNGRTGTNMFWRAKNLVDMGYIQGDGSKAIVVLENGNDMMMYNGQTGGLEQALAYEFNPNARVLVPTTPLEGYTNVDDVPSNLRALNACMTYLNSKSGCIRMSVATLPSSAGTIKLTIGTAIGSYVYEIAVTPQSTTEATMSHVIDKILECQYTNVSDIDGGDGESVIFAPDTGDTISVSFEDVGNTGMTMTKTTGVTGQYKMYKFFVGDDVADWEDATKWELYFNSLNIYSRINEGYKSIIEYLQRTYPKIHIFIGSFPSHAAKPSTYLKPNGTYDTYAYSQSDRMQRFEHFSNVLEDIAKFYSVGFINVFKDCGITISNKNSFYINESTNVHPIDAGYERFGETMAAGILRYIVG